MQALTDSLLVSLMTAECRDATPLLRFQRASSLVEELLNSIGFPEAAKTLRKFREQCGELPVEAPRDEPVHIHTQIIAEPCDDPLIGKPKRKRQKVEAGPDFGEGVQS